jgi:hypothetical protein
MDVLGLKVFTQAVPSFRRLVAGVPPRWSRLKPRIIYVEFVEDKETLGKVFFEYFGFLCVIPPTAPCSLIIHHLGCYKCFTYIIQTYFLYRTKEKYSDVFIYVWVSFRHVLRVKMYMPYELETWRRRDILKMYVTTLMQTVPTLI